MAGRDAGTVVLGAGLAGAAVAAALGPDELLLIEQGAAPGGEASAQNAGMIRLLVEDPVERRLALRGEELLRERHGGELRRTGAVHGLAHDPGELDDAVAALRAAGHEVRELVHPAEVAPVLAGARLRRAWFVPGAGVANPQGLLDALLVGHRVLRGCRAEAIELRAGRVVGLRTSLGSISCQRLVLAAGAWSGALAAAAGLQRPLVPIRRSLHLSAPHPLARPDHPWCWLEDLGLYLRPEAGRWLLSGCDERPDPPPPGPGSQRALDPPWTEQVAQRLLETLPALGDLALDGGWSGLRTFAPDRRPLLGPDPEVEGLYWAAGLGGFGLTAHLAVGELVADWIRGQPPTRLRPEDVAVGRPLPRRWRIFPRGTRQGARLIEGRYWT